MSKDGHGVMDAPKAKDQKGCKNKSARGDDLGPFLIFIEIIRPDHCLCSVEV